MRTEFKYDCRWTSVVVAWIALLGPIKALAYSYGPESEAEWMGWPEYCKARYMISDGGRSSEYAGRVSAEVVSQWQGRFGECWGYLHHFCGGILQEQRAKSARTKQLRAFALDSAIKEHKFALSVCPATNPVSSEMLVHLGMSYFEIGDSDKAFQSMDAAIRNHPSYDGAYIAKSIVLRKSGKAAEALQVLRQGSEATGGGSAELENALGLALFDERLFDDAREHARKAYALGYPLPGLRDKLRRAGFPL